MRVCEIFMSIQGESTLAGLPCAFVRLTGCNLRCAYCDTTYAYDGGSEMSMDEIVSKVMSFGASLVEVTGGEPMMQNETPALLQALTARGLATMIETNGSLDISAIPRSSWIIMDIKTPSSGMHEKMRLENIAHLKPSDEIKLVISGRQDYEWARALISERGLAGICTVLLSPAFGVLPPRMLVEWMLQDGLNARLNLQLHKYIFGPEERGV